MEGGASKMMWAAPPPLRRRSAAAAALALYRVGSKPTTAATPDSEAEAPAT